MNNYFKNNLFYIAIALLLTYNSPVWADDNFLYDIDEINDIEDIDISELEYDYKDKYAAVDPLESVNRGVFIFNKTINRILIKRLISIYDGYLPHAIASRVYHFLQNFREPITFINEILQFKFRSAGSTLGRFITNSTWGLFGLHDITAEAGIKRTEEGFSDTLRFYNIGQGAYLVTPFLGPTSLRNALGTISDVTINPIKYYMNQGNNIALGAVNFMDVRSHLKDTLQYIESSSLDEYASVRSLYLQNDK